MKILAMALLLAVHAAALLSTPPVCATEAAAGAAPRKMERASVDGIELEYELRGAGEPIVFIHNGAGVDWFRPLLDQPALAKRYRVLSYRRVGYGGSSKLAGPISFAQEAAHCRSLMRHLKIERALVVGHSSTGILALKLALDAPDVVHSLALLEPALMAVPSPPQVLEAVQLHRSGETARAIDTFLQGTCGPDYRAALEKVFPKALAEAMASADRFFGQEIPALRQLSFGPEDAKRIAQPVLLVLGERSDARHRERRDLLSSWLPNAETFVLPQASHLLHIENPRGMAEGLAAFYARHPIR